MDHRAAFLDAMKKKNPTLYAFLARNAPQLLHVPGHAAMHVAGFGATAPASSTAPQSNTSWWQSLLTNIGQAIPMGIQTYQEIQMAKAQVAAAKAGRPPIPVQKYVAASPPTATVQVGVNPDTQKTMLYVAGGIGVLILFAMMNSKKGKARSRA